MRADELNEQRLGLSDLATARLWASASTQASTATDKTARRRNTSASMAPTCPESASSLPVLFVSLMRRAEAFLPPKSAREPFQRSSARVVRPAVPLAVVYTHFSAQSSLPSRHGLVTALSRSLRCTGGCRGSDGTDVEERQTGRICRHRMRLRRSPLRPLTSLPRYADAGCVLASA